MDGTYKTNRFGHVCINICGSSGNNMTPHFAIGFLSGESKNDYLWLLGCVMKLLEEHSIAHPTCFVFDRELSLMKALDQRFPHCDHILYVWHVNMNVVAKTKKYFQFQEDWDEFFTAWIILVEFPSFDDYRKKLTAFQAMNPKAARYCEKTWLIRKGKKIRCGVDLTLNFKNRTTSRNEGLHAAMKACLSDSCGDHKDFFDAICFFWANQRRITKEADSLRKIVTRHAHDIVLFQDIIPYVHPFAMDNTTVSESENYAQIKGLFCMHYAIPLLLLFTQVHG
ncbi:hypothetical protein K3495_g10848 [Podosphaera aphanis]|nr:hypothetical protein K3495_g10848 [Podosphaera aphanis]